MDDLDYMRSRMDILDCLNRYTRGMDRLDRDSALSAFHVDAQLDYGIFVGNPAEFFAYFHDFHTRFHHSTFHNLCNHVCELDGDSAHTETYFFCAVNNKDAPKFTLGGGRYIDRFERRDGRWGIAVRKCVGGWDAVPQESANAEIMRAFAAVGKIARGTEDLSYQRPLTVAPERFGTTRKL